MGAAAPYLDPALWRDWVQAGAEHLSYAAFWLAVLQITFVNLLLSGDNAIVIAMACRGLPAPQRRWGMILGAAIAVVLRIAFTVVVARLLELAYLKLVGGLALLYIAAKLLVPERADRSEVQAVAQLWRAVWIVIVADIVMSFDNIVAVATVAQGDFLLLAIGLAVSIPLIIAGAALTMALLGRFPILIWIGAALLGWVAGETIATDPAVAALAAKVGGGLQDRIEFAAAGAAALIAVAAGGLWRQWHELKLRDAQRREAARLKTDTRSALQHRTDRRAEQQRLESGA